MREAHDYLVLIVDDHELVRSALVTALAGHGMTAVGIGPHELAERRREPAPVGGLVLLDLDLGTDLDGDLDGAGLVPDLRRAGWRVLIVTGSTDESRIAAAVAAGAAGWVSKSAPLDELLDAAVRAAQGRRLLDDAEHARLCDLAGDAQRTGAELDRRWSLLTPREEQVALLLGSGLGPTAIAEQSFVSVATVRTQIRAILSKLGVRSQLEAAAVARRRR